MIVATITTIISTGRGTGNFSQNLSFMSLPVNKIMKEIIAITRTDVFVVAIFLPISIAVCKKTKN